MKVLTPIKAMRAKCMDCTCNQPKEIRECGITNCSLWPYRMGKRPKKHKTDDRAEPEPCEAAAGVQ